MVVAAMSMLRPTRRSSWDLLVFGKFQPPDWDMRYHFEVKWKRKTQ